MSSSPDSLEQAVLGGGCFWCIEAVYQDVEGVHAAVSGYAGGAVPNPSYAQVCSGTTGHAEVVRVSFDPETIGYADVLRIFFAVHDPTTKDRQGADVGPQYRSIVLTTSEAQAETARRVVEEIEAEGIWDAPLVTEIEPLERFYEAEPHHQRYFERNPGQGYCRVVIAPKVAKFRERFAHRLRTAG